MQVCGMQIILYALLAIQYELPVPVQVCVCVFPCQHFISHAGWYWHRVL